MPAVQMQIAPILLPTMGFLRDSLGELGWNVRLSPNCCDVCIRSCLIFAGQTSLQEDTLYLLPAEFAGAFPQDDFPFLTNAEISGKAPHLCCIGSFPELLNAALEVFTRFRDFELELRGILSGGGSLSDLCSAGSRFFRNPMYIHDDMFTVLAMSANAEDALNFEYNERTGKLYLPLQLINDFKLDPTYQHTLELTEAGTWDSEQSTRGIRSLFVNLWDEGTYLGRLLISQFQNQLPAGYARAAEQFARYIVLLLQRDGKNQSHAYQDFESILLSLMEGNRPDARDMRAMLQILGWDESDRYLCLKLQDQNANASIRPDRALDGELSSVLDGFACFHHQRRVCIVINLTVSHSDVSQIRLRLAPYIRDSLMYGGISNPVTGIYALSQGFRQTDLVLDHISVRDNSQWLLPFSACALQYFHSCITQEMPARLLADPALLELQRYDAENGTPYYETLRTYLLSERSIPKTADALIIHRTTLTYRLRKIEELVRLNLDDDEQRQYILFSIFLLDENT